MKEWSRWARFSLRSFFVITSLFAVWISVRAQRAHNERLVAHLASPYGSVIHYDYQSVSANPAQSTPPGPKWLRDAIGIEFFAEMTGLHIYDGKRMPEADRRALVTAAGKLRHLNAFTFYEADPVVVDAVSEHLPKLQLLALTGEGVDDASLAKLQGMKELQTLRLSSTRVDGRGFVYLAELPNLRELLLQRAKVTDEGLQNIVLLKQLRSLSLNSTQITNEGLKPVGGVRSLERLSVMNCNVTNDCLIHFRSLPNLRELRGLDIPAQFPKGNIPLGN